MHCYWSLPLSEDDRALCGGRGDPWPLKSHEILQMTAKQSALKLRAYRYYIFTRSQLPPDQYMREGELCHYLFCVATCMDWANSAGELRPLALDALTSTVCVRLSTAEVGRYMLDFTRCCCLHQTKKRRKKKKQILYFTLVLCWYQINCINSELTFYFVYNVAAASQIRNFSVILRSI